MSATSHMLARRLSSRLADARHVNSSPSQSFSSSKQHRAPNNMSAFICQLLLGRVQGCSPDAICVLKLTIKPLQPNPCIACGGFMPVS
jgi:hypothetical protein